MNGLAGTRSPIVLRAEMKGRCTKAQSRRTKPHRRYWKGGLLLNIDMTAHLDQVNSTVPIQISKCVEGGGTTVRCLEKNAALKSPIPIAGKNEIERRVGDIQKAIAIEVGRDKEAKIPGRRRTDHGLKCAIPITGEKEQ